MSALLSSQRFGAAAAEITFVGTTYAASAVAGLAYPPGMAVGDVALFFMAVEPGSGGEIPSGWSGGTFGMGTGNGAGAYASRVITGSEGVNVAGLATSNKAVVAVYRGATAAVFKTHKSVALDPDTGYPAETVASLALNYTKTAGARLEIGMLFSREALAGQSVPWASRASSALYNLFDAASGDYTSGSTLTTSWSSPTSQKAYALYFELTGTA